MFCVCVLKREHSVDGSDLTSTLCKGDLFVLGSARVQRVRMRSICSELLMCSGGVHSISYCLL